mmetsp:Transcript_146680/g.470676  ORF Transcript_146680/g.470676 Transcript_146680/m.470676 type:complete len:605 (-) Transcript_146680:207-2021(-)
MVEPQTPKFAPESRASDQNEGASPFSVGKYSVAFDDDSQPDTLESVGSVGGESPSRTQVPIATTGPKLFHNLERDCDQTTSSSLFDDLRRLPQRDMPREDTLYTATTISIDGDTLRWGLAGRPLDLLLSDPPGIVKPGGAAGDAASREVTRSSGVDTAVPQPGPQFPRSRSGGSAAPMSTSSLVLSMRDGGGGGVTFGPSTGGAPRHTGAGSRRAAEVDGSGGGGRDEARGGVAGGDVARGSESSGGGVGQGPPIRSASRASSSSYCGLTHAEEKQTFQLDPEEEEWDTRQQQTGAAGRIVVYEVGDRPREDLTLRGGGAHHRIMVAAVTDGGKAAMAGVKAGDVLVSINGLKEFKGKSADAVHVTLRAPLTLVFLGFVGKLQAEVRLNYKQKSLGLSSSHQVIFGRPDAPVQVTDAIVFQPTNATLLLATKASSQEGPSKQGGFRGDNGPAHDMDDDESGEETDIIDIDTLTGPSLFPHNGTTAAAAAGLRTREPRPLTHELTAVYELRGQEARKLVSRALARAAMNDAFLGDGRRVGGGGDGNTDQKPALISSRSVAFSGRFAGQTPPPEGVGVRGNDEQKPSSRICDESWWGARCRPHPQD